ncbi:MAG: metal-dependent hydrolase [Acidobacteria bacterium]|nr:metal-dependent hydrolase [Acidobacteriota bacterium]
MSVVCYFIASMDNVTHSLVGAALAETGLKRWTPLATTTLILGANFPDIDIVIGFNTLTYLEHHRGITHAIIAIPLLAALLAGFVYVGSHWWQRKHPEHQVAKFWPLFFLSLISMSTHPLLDFTNSYGWRPFLPWNHTWYYGDIDFVVDPWLWASLGGTLMLVTATTQRRLIGWSLLFFVLALPVIFFAGTPWPIKIGWLVFVSLLFGLRTFLRLDVTQTQRLMRGLIGAVLIYFCLLVWLQKTALEKIQAAAPMVIQFGEQVIKTDAMPIPANPLLWRTVISTDRAFYFSDQPLFYSASPVVRRYERESGEAAAITAALREPELQAFLRFARFPSISAERQQDQTTQVEIRDVRFFDLDSRTNGTFRTSIRLDAQMRRLVE